MIRITQKPIKPLPPNAVRATHIQHVGSLAHKTPECSDYGVYRLRERGTAAGNLYLMSWGRNYQRATVEATPNRRYVWIGTCSVGAGECDAFEVRR